MYDEPSHPCDDCEDKECSKCEHALDQAIQTQKEQEQIKAGLKFTVSVDDEMISSIILGEAEKRVAESLQSRIRDMVNRAFEDCLRNHWSSSSFKEILEKIVREKLNEVYPDVVQNKVNELEKQIKEMTFKDRNESVARDIHQRAVNMVNAYIEKELSISVKKTKEEIDEFAKNYFAKNLFRAMGLMNNFTETTHQIKG